jgi:hypothetical protein
VGRGAGDSGRARGELTLEQSEMRLELLYTVTFTTPEAWSVEGSANAGIEGRSFLLAEGRSTGRLSARYRAANFPRKRADGTLVPEFRGVLETDDGAVILFEWQGLAVLTDSGMRRLLGSLVHMTDDPRYRWLNDSVCAIEGEVHPRTDGSGFEVVYEVSEMVWEGVARARSVSG